MQCGIMGVVVLAIIANDNVPDTTRSRIIFMLERRNSPLANWLAGSPIENI